MQAMPESLAAIWDATDDFHDAELQRIVCDVWNRDMSLTLYCSYAYDDSGEDYWCLATLRFVDLKGLSLSNEEGVFPETGLVDRLKYEERDGILWFTLQGRSRWSAQWTCSGVLYSHTPGVVFPLRN